MPTTVILGTGIIGLSTAYYLSHLAESDLDNTPTPANAHLASTASSATPNKKETHHIHLVEPCPELFASASGKAAGFLAKDWFAPAVAPLGAFSFDLHRQLAQAHDGHARWDWSESVSYSLDRDDSEVDEDEVWQFDGDGDDDEVPDASEHVAQAGVTNGGANGEAKTSGKAKSRTQNTDLGWLMDGSSRMTLLEEPAVNANGSDENPRWLRAKKNALQAISDRTTTGQVDPYRLCQFLLSECQARGVTLHHPARATQLTHVDPADPSSPTIIRLEYLDASGAADAEGRSATPNSTSPPRELNASGTTGTTSNGSSANTDPGNRPSLRGSWASFTTPLEDALPEGLAGGDYYMGAAPEANDVPKANTNGKKTRSGLNGFGTGKTIDVRCDSIVIAAGCWTPRVYRTLFPNAGRIPRVTPLAGHSMVLKSKRWPPVKSKKQAEVNGSAGVPQSEVANRTSGHGKRSSSCSSRSSDSTNHTVTVPTSPVVNGLALNSVCHAVFTGDHAGYSPEIFSRLGGDVWLGGLNSSAIALPALASQATPDPKAVATLLHTARALCGKDVEVLRTGLCFRPVAPTGRPVLARMHEADLGDGAKVGGGVFVATGHGPWGISMSLGTGYVMGEMVLGREPSVDVKALGTWEAQAP